MIRRRTTESGGGVLSFTFLDVLTCTMGSLVLLLVVLAQRSTNVTLEEALKNAHKPRAAAGDPLPTGPNTTDVVADAGGDVESESPEPEEESQLTPEELAKSLAELREQMPRLEKLRQEAAERARAEEARVSHLEEHERRLEHELAQLHFALARLEETEKQQNVDQQTAEKELERLRQLVDDTEARIESLQKESTGKKSYAIVPYKGANGTFRRPIYIECTKDAVTIYPEGIKLTAADFDGPLRSGNPLAAVIRAAREELNARAKAAGQTDLPDPYPLLIVRPDGAYAYGAATSAISSWDSDFGYEFVDADWKLEYPAYDPKLDQVMRHAVDQARQRQAMLAKAAPRRYGSRLALGAGEGGDGGGDGTGGGGGAFAGVAHAGGSGDRIGDHSGENWMEASGATSGSESGSQSGGGAGKGLGASATGAAAGTFADQGGTSQPGMAGGPGGPGIEQKGAAAQAGGAAALADAGSGQRAPGNSGQGDVSGGVAGGTAAAGGTDAGATQAGGKPAAHDSGAVAGTSGGGGSPSSASSAQGNSGGAAMSSAGGADSQSGQSGGIVQYSPGQTASAAQSRGANWANGAASRRASAITRPIRVIVRPSQIDVIPDADDRGGTPTAITFHQSTDKVLDQLAASVQEHIKDWGLAGNGMYWRPTLVLQVSPGAEQHAARLNDLLRDSGVDVRFDEVASRTEEGGNRGPR